MVYLLLIMFAHITIVFMFQSVDFFLGTFAFVCANNYWTIRIGSNAC